MGLARFGETDFIYPTCLDWENGLTREVYRAWLEALIDGRTGVQPPPFRPCVFDKPGEGQANKWPPFQSAMRSTVRGTVLGSDWGLDDSTSSPYPPRSWQADQGKVKVTMPDGTDALLSIPTRICAQLLYRQRAVFSEFCQDVVRAWDAGYDGNTLGYRLTHQAELPCGCFLWARRKRWQHPAPAGPPGQQARARRTSAPGPVPASLREGPSRGARPAGVNPPPAYQLPTSFASRRPATPVVPAAGQARQRSLSGNFGPRPGAAQGAASRSEMVPLTSAAPQARQDSARQVRAYQGNSSEALDRVRTVLQRRRSQEALSARTASRQDQRPLPAADENGFFPRLPAPGPSRTPSVSFGDRRPTRRPSSRSRSSSDDSVPFQVDSPALRDEYRPSAWGHFGRR